MTDPRAVRPYMPDYGVPSPGSADGVDELLPWSWANERLVGSRNYWLVTASSSGRPHALPVWGVWRPPQSDFAFSCAASSRKSRNLVVNPQVCVAIDDTVECVSVEGLAARVDDALERRALIDAYTDKYADEYADTPGGAEARAELAAFVDAHELWRVVPERAFGLIERPDEFSERATKWVW